MSTRSKSLGDCNASVLRAQELRKLYRRLNSVPESSARQSDREEIRRKLAMGSDDDYANFGTGDRSVKKAGNSLQLCYINHVPHDDTDLASSQPVTSSQTVSSSSQAVTSSSFVMTNTAQNHQRQQKYTWAASLAACSSSSSPASSSSSSSCVSSSSSSPSSFSSAAAPSSCGNVNNSSNSNNNNNSSLQQSSLQTNSGQHDRARPHPGGPEVPFSAPLPEETLVERQQRLQQEARVALAQANIMARMQMEVERKNRKRSPIADIVGVPDLGDGRRLKIPRKLLQEMNFAQLQVLVNDLHSQIESLNEELVHLLIERDDLHMEQDSMLVDIEDLTSFAQHMSETNNNKTTLNNRNSSLKKKKTTTTTTTTSSSSSSTSTSNQPGIVTGKPPPANSTTNKRFSWARNPTPGVPHTAANPFTLRGRRGFDSVNGNE